MKKETVDKLKEVNKLLKEINASLETEGVHFYYRDVYGDELHFDAWKAKHGKTTK